MQTTQTTQTKPPLDADLAVRQTAAALASPYGRPSAGVSMDLRRLVDVFVGQVKTWRGSSTSTSDFYFDFARMTGGEGLDRVMRRIGLLADATAARLPFVSILRDLGVRIAVDLPEYSSGFLSRDPNLAGALRAPRFAVWFDGVQIRVRDVLLVGTANSSRTPDDALEMPDLLESEASLRAFLTVVTGAIATLTKEPVL
ncbi:MAG TPA: hypothetical protein VMZ28_17525 [Kofleriaceae bacterium]|nr:hypothetical protein [Kofleriaceae bacterium]